MKYLLLSLSLLLLTSCVSEKELEAANKEYVKSIEDQCKRSGCGSCGRYFSCNRPLGAKQTVCFVENMCFAKWLEENESQEIRYKYGNQD